MANFKTLSRYTGGQVATDREGVNFIVLRTALNLQPADDDIFITVPGQLANRPDLISFNVYSTVDLWWVIYEFNGIQDPLFGVPPNTVLRIPSLDRVLQAIAALQTT
jgi:hypothetical protein